MANLPAKIDLKIIKACRKKGYVFSRGYTFEDDNRAMVLPMIEVKGKPFICKPFWVDLKAPILAQIPRPVFPKFCKSCGAEIKNNA